MTCSQIGKLMNVKKGDNVSYKSMKKSQPRWIRNILEEVGVKLDVDQWGLSDKQWKANLNLLAKAAQHNARYIEIDKITNLIERHHKSC